MSLTRPRLKLDEQSFEELLAAAYTVQEHNARQAKTAGMHTVCARCGLALPALQQWCGHCGAAREEPRPGEQMQRKWASLWLMSQQQGWRPERPVIDEAGLPSPPPESGTSSWPLVASAPATEALSGPEADVDEPGLELLVPEAADLPGELVNEAAATAEDSEPGNLRQWDLRFVLRFRRADLYLGVAVLLSFCVLTWALWATPVSIRGRDGQRVQLTLGERVLVKLGIAEAPDAPVYRGNPNVQVWADPHTALYYCAGDEQYGKTPDGHVSSQREAQMDRFAPAGRAPCE